MLLISFAYIIQLVLILSTNQVGSQIFSSSAAAKARRAQSMRPLTQMTEFSSSLQSAASSSSLATALAQQNMDVKTKPKAASSSPAIAEVLPSTSKDQSKTIGPCASECLQEVDLRPLIEDRRSSLHASFQAALQGTHSGGNLNPARHGVFARVRNALLQHSVSTAIGIGIGVGVSQLEQSFQNESTHFDVNATTSVSNTTNDSIILSNSTHKTSEEKDGITKLL